MNPQRPLSRPGRHNLAAKGFTLVELAVVLVIVALLASGMTMSLTAQQEAQRLSEVRRQLADIREALLGYAVATGRLPPPANPAKKAGVDADAGSSEEGRSLGVLPWATLGLPETDPWGRRFTYRITDSFGKIGAAPALANFSLTSNGDITITDGAANIASNTPAVVVSHGKNGRGAYRPDGGLVADAAGDEAENADGDKAFVSRGQAADYDDEVVWIPLHLLLNRMVSSGRLP